MSGKKTAVVVCPGRGSYNRTELGYLKEVAAESRWLKQFDAVREQLGLSTVTALDQAAVFSSRVHLKAENAAALIYSCGIADFATIDREQVEIVAVTGNSMGWYTALGCAGVWQGDSQMQLVTGMAQLTAEAAVAQFIYPLVNSDWQPDAAKKRAVAEQLWQHQGALFMSIVYGGYAVLAGAQQAVQAAMQALPACNKRFPLLLLGHAAFHSPLMQPVSEQAMSRFAEQLFHPPQLPLIDGRGQIWPAGLAQAAVLKAYTLGDQVCQTYHFSKAIEVAVKEFAPDHLILLDPGSSLGGAVAQSLIAVNWHNWQSKADFSQAQQTASPFVLSMGLLQQRSSVV